MHEALANSDLLLAEAEEYSAQLEQRLQAALQWRLEVEQQVQQQSGEKEALHQQLQMLKTRLDLSPGATPSKPLAKVEALKGEAKCALDRLRVESEANAEERARRNAAEEDLGSMRCSSETLHTSKSAQRRRRNVRKRVSCGSSWSRRCCR